MGIHEKIKELEDEMARTQKNKATEFHVGMLKAKIAKLKRAIIETPKKSFGGKGGGGSGFDVKKSGDATVVFIGLPSVGKSTLLNALTGAKSKTASYAFTTLTCIPGVMEHRGAQIQLLDLPGIIAGAKTGKGRGREILAVARNADLILIILDVFEPNMLSAIKEELSGIGIRLDQKPPQIHLTKKERGGIEINSTVKLTKLNDKMITGVINEYGVHNGSIVFRDDASIDQLVDYMAANRRYINSVTVLNKTDLVSEEYLRSLKFPFLPISADRNTNINSLKDAIYDRLELIRIYTKPRMGEADMKKPMMMRSGSNVSDACSKLHRDLVRDFKYAQVWGPSAKFPGQKVGIDHVLQDGDVVTIVKKQG
ncbi:GTP-binding protein [Candidatus Micrarchaeota archaeon]|nr:GTP-binding protein [Candidatus Micrarchaeota archaeon]